MLFLVIFLAIGLVIAGVLAMTQSQAASSARASSEALEGRVRALEGELATTTTKLEVAEQAAHAAEQRADGEARRADNAEKDGRRSDEMAEDAVKRAIASERVASEAVERAERAEAAVVDAQRDRDATLAGAGPFQPEALWRLEVQRIERLWRDRLALQPHEPSPFTGDHQDLGAALRILADASREESGVVVDLMWHVDFECPPDRCIQLVRLGEELIAAMRESEGGELEVIGEEDRTVFFLVRTLPPIELPERLTGVFDDFGAMRELADTTVVVRVPARDDAKMADAGAAESEPESDAEGQAALFADADLTAGPAVELTGDGTGTAPAPAGDGAPAAS